MNKLLAILGIILVVSLMGCQKQEPLPAADLPEIEAETDDSIGSEEVPETEAPETIPDAEVEEMPEAEVEEEPEVEPETTAEPAKVDISQEELDALAAELEGMEFEDLNAIS